MADEPKAGGEGGGAPATEPDKPSAAVPDSKPDQPAGDDENAKLRAEVEAHRKNQEKWQREIEEARAIKASRDSQPPSPTTNPWAAHDASIMEAAEALKQYPNDPAYKETLEARIRRKQEAIAQDMWQRAEPEFQKVPAEFRERAQRIWIKSQGTISPAEAGAAAMGEAAPSLREKLAQQEKELEETKKDLEARKRGTFATGGAPVLEPRQARTLPDGTAVYPLAEWKKRATLPAAERAKLNRLYKEGKILVEH